jgi:serine/threonine protein kinase
MAIPLHFPMLAKMAGTAGGVGTATIYLWRMLKNRTCSSIRKRLRVIGISDEKAVREWMAEWPDDPDPKRAQKARRWLSDEKKREAVARALTDLVRNREFQQLDGWMARAMTPFSAVGQTVMPPAVGTREREALDLHGHFVLEELRRFKTAYRSGYSLRTARELLTLKRLLKLTAYGEVWLASAAEARMPESEIPAADRRIVHFLTKASPLPDVTEIREELKPLNSVEGVLRAQVVKDKETPVVVTEYAAGGSLKQWLLAEADQRVKLNKEEIMASIIKTLAKSHDRKIFHRRICAESIVLTIPFEPGRTAVNVEAKLADFWLSRLTSVAVDPVYAAPVGKRASVLAAEDRYPKNDIFALGVLWYQVMTGDSDLERPPYDFYEQLDDTGRSCREWIKECLAYSESQFDDAVELWDRMSGAHVEIVPPVDRPAAKPIEGFFDVSDLLQDYLLASAA